MVSICGTITYIPEKLNAILLEELPVGFILNENHLQLDDLYLESPSMTVHIYALNQLYMPLPEPAWSYQFECKYKTELVEAEKLILSIGMKIQKNGGNYVFEYGQCDEKDIITGKEYQIRSPENKVILIFDHNKQ
jgi:hypothetical protein